MEGQLERVLAAIDAANGKDPGKARVDGTEVAEALLYGRRMTAWLSRRAPEAPDVLAIAARGQHICRWQIPRSEYPQDRQGYLRWRTTLYRFHADQIEPLMREGGYSEDEISRMRGLVEKKGIKTNPEMQILEDVICLVFLEHYFEDFLKQHPRDKVIDIVRKTWGKMSEDGHQLALGLTLGDAAMALIGEALNA